MNLSALTERFPTTHQVLIKDLKTVLEACRLFSEPVTRLPVTKEEPANLNLHLDFALSVYADKFQQLYESLAESLIAERYLVYAQLARSILENAATLRYYAKDSEIARLRTPGQLEPEVLQAIALKIHKLVRGSRFSWQAFVEGRLAQLKGEADHEEVSQINVQTCFRHWYRESPQIESLYAMLCDMVHPNLGSGLLVIRSEPGYLLAGGSGGSSAALNLVLPTLAGTIGAFKIVQRSFQELDESRIKSETA